jgi:hypothetical protein
MRELCLILLGVAIGIYLHQQRINSHIDWLNSRIDYWKGETEKARGEQQ